MDELVANSKFNDKCEFDRFAKTEIRKNWTSRSWK